MKIMMLFLAAAMLTVALPADPEGFDMIDAASRAQENVKVRNVAVFVHEGVELLDFAGPGEVFAAAHTKGGAHAFNVYTVAASAEPIISQGFLSVRPQYTFENAPRPDIVVLPGGRTNIPLQNPKVVEWVKKTSRDAEVMMSVCTGAFLLARAGLLDGKEATTHWGSIERLKQEATKTTVLENRRFIDNGKVLTTAGVSAGIDGALHVVARLLGHEEARRTARYMEYLWAPEKNTDVEKSSRQ
jgi:transcriptional regulator GlxA family with amidase domain